MKSVVDGLTKEVDKLEKMNAAGEAHRQELEAKRNRAKEDLDDAKQMWEEKKEQRAAEQMNKKKLDKEIETLRSNLEGVKKQLQQQDEMLKITKQLEKELEAKKAEMADASKALEEQNKQHEDTLPRLRLLKENENKITKAEASVKDVETFLTSIWTKIRNARQNDHLVVE